MMYRNVDVGVLGEVRLLYGRIPFQCGAYDKRLNDSMKLVGYVFGLPTTHSHIFFGRNQMVQHRSTFSSDPKPASHICYVCNMSAMRFTI